MLFLALCSRPSADLSQCLSGTGAETIGLEGLDLEPVEARLLSTCEYLSTTHSQLLYIHIPVKSSQSSFYKKYIYEGLGYFLPILVSTLELELKGSRLKSNHIYSI